jgi:diacylglycerol kinase
LAKEKSAHRQFWIVSLKVGLVMSALHTSANAIYLMQILVSALLAILFLQSGIDKIVDRRGNLEWLRGHFAKSPLAGTVPALLTAITILEVAAGVLSAVGCVLVLVMRDSTVAFCGAVISAVAITALFFGQRVAKDYAGAAVLVPYFLLVLVAIYLLAHG